MQVSARDSIRIFGWWDQPRNVLTWSDCKEHGYTWGILRDELQFSPQQLHALQKDKVEWVHRGCLRLCALPEMTMFPVNPLSDMRADIGELCVMQWRAATLASMGVTYAQMAKAGMTPRIMTFFRFPLSDWVVLSLAPTHLELWTDADTLGTFGVALAELTCILHDHAARDYA